VRDLVFLDADRTTEASSKCFRRPQQWATFASPRTKAPGVILARADRFRILKLFYLACGTRRCGPALAAGFF